MHKDDTEESCDYAAFTILVYEFAGDETRKTDLKIRNALRRKHLGAYDPARVTRLRALKDDLQRELGQPSSSGFYRGPTSQYASPADFDQVGLVDDLARRYPEVGKQDLGRMVSISLYVNYLR